MVRVYQKIGLLLMITGSILAGLTYFFMGFNPLFALWFGLVIIGASMYLTPEETIGRREVLLFIEYALSNIARLVEAMGIGSSNLYRCINGEVYIYAGNNLDETIDTDPSKTMIIFNKDNEPILILRSPISRGIIEGYNDICSAIDYVVTEYLGIAENTRCVDSDEQVVVDIDKPKISSPASLEKSIGSIYGIIVSSIASMLGTGKAVLLVDEKRGGGRRIVVGKLR
ncbi:hypothetical protein Shell_0872 [Staphylothermus hellenicus DSM 12710]|uniref:Uncharacterized protein n=1 Tax=Staphylothermus hellenicus (strain DSM 12710 / JCM 10830 / BK20S6-10-b1 / P8) TaxID=591019 RepID=D7D886_STAHD|nr:hypothetical protein Shell_0872 [Staphylothermus hellenicus DSM 12710]